MKSLVFRYGIMPKLLGELLELLERQETASSSGSQIMAQFRLYDSLPALILAASMPRLSAGNLLWCSEDHVVELSWRSRLRSQRQVYYLIGSGQFARDLLGIELEAPGTAR